MTAKKTSPAKKAAATAAHKKYAEIENLLGAVGQDAKPAKARAVKPEPEPKVSPESTRADRQPRAKAEARLAEAQSRLAAQGKLPAEPTVTLPTKPAKVSEAEIADAKHLATRLVAAHKASKAEDAEPATKQSPKPVAKSGTKRGGYAPTACITVLNKECPHADGSVRALAFASALRAKTVADYTGKPKYLARWVESGHIKIG